MLALQTFIFSNQYNSEGNKVKDDERLQRIDSIYLEMQDRYQFSRYFISQIKLLVISRLKEKNEVNKLSSLYPIK